MNAVKFTVRIHCFPSCRRDCARPANAGCASLTTQSYARVKHWLEIGGQALICHQGPRGRDPSKTQDAGNLPTPIFVPENAYKGVSHFHNVSPFDRR
jgi:hypothetical protein